LADNLVVMEMGRRTALGGREDWPLHEPDFYRAGLPGCLIRAVARGWGLQEEVAESLITDVPRHREQEVEIGSHRGQPVIADVTRVDRP
jgi:hypothetical protein